MVLNFLFIYTDPDARNPLFLVRLLLLARGAFATALQMCGYHQGCIDYVLDFFQVNQQPAPAPICVSSCNPQYQSCPLPEDIEVIDDSSEDLVCGV